MAPGRRSYDPTSRSRIYAEASEGVLVVAPVADDPRIKVIGLGELNADVDRDAVTGVRAVAVEHVAAIAILGEAEVPGPAPASGLDPRDRSPLDICAIRVVAGDELERMVASRHSSPREAYAE